MHGTAMATLAIYRYIATYDIVYIIMLHILVWTRNRMAWLVIIAHTPVKYRSLILIIIVLNFSPCNNHD